MINTFLQENGNGVCLLTRRTTRNPDADWVAVHLVLDKLHQRLFLEHFKALRIAKETRHSNKEFLKQRRHFDLIFLKVSGILLGAIKLMDVHTPLDAPTYGILFVNGEIMPRLIAQDHADHPQSIGNILVGDIPLDSLQTCLLHIANKCLGHIFRR